MKIVIGYFGPFLSIKRNIGQDIVPFLNKYQSVELPVTFNKKHFLKPIQKDTRTYIILGHDPDGKKIKLEKNGKNIRFGYSNKLLDYISIKYMDFLWLFKKNIKMKETNTNGLIDRKIIQGPLIRKQNCNIDLPKNWEYSEDAGKFVCNFAIYVVNDFISSYKNNINFYFLHIPENYSPKQAAVEINDFIESSKQEILGK